MSAAEGITSALLSMGDRAGKLQALIEMERHVAHQLAGLIDNLDNVEDEALVVMRVIDRIKDNIKDAGTLIDLLTVRTHEEISEALAKHEQQGQEWA